MKKFNLFLFFAAAIFSLVIVSCDKIKTPTQSSQVKVSNRKVLLEDYTGHKCGNCPNAARVAESLEKKYGSKLIVIAVHAGFFTKINPLPFVTSYTCQAGNEWDAASGFGVSANGNPNGMVNRKDFGGGLVQKETKWGASVSQAFNAVDICKLFLTTTYDEGSRKLNATIKTKFVKSYGHDTKVTVVFTEDSIIGPQTDYNVPVGTPDVIENYVFMHMLRGSINGTWGELVKKAPIAYNDSVTVSYKEFDLDPKFKDKNVSVIAFVYDADTREVLQVEKVKIR